MLESLLGVSDKSIVKSSNYYGHVFAALAGLVAMLLGIGALLFKYSAKYKEMCLLQNDNIEYLKFLSEEIKNQKLLNISKFYAINFDTLVNLYQDFAGLSIFIGVILISNFILFRKLRNKLLAENRGY